MIPDLDPNSDAEILQIFCNPFLQTNLIITSRGPNPKCYTFLETSHDPELVYKLIYNNLANFCATLICKLSSESPDKVQSQVQTPKIKRSKTPLDFRILYSQNSTILPPVPSTILPPVPSTILPPVPPP